ncbi:hypothetical protein NU08_1892 [Flavobacterium anhuiense]|uniref:Uncharacterized protein n=1 Tax=Flavobacterium anhuiense TaxID=459526 RepID=A0A444VZU5_9FLAO|nr:hypothetical protein NU08_1892 [Flavobacterium anhuiense]
MGLICRQLYKLKKALNFDLGLFYLNPFHFENHRIILIAISKLTQTDFLLFVL